MQRKGILLPIPLCCVCFQGLWEGGEGGKGPRDGGIECWKMGSLLGGKWGCLVLAWEDEWGELNECLGVGPGE